MERRCVVRSLALVHEHGGCRGVRSEVSDTTAVNSSLELVSLRVKSRKFLMNDKGTSWRKDNKV